MAPAMYLNIFICLISTRNFAFLLNSSQYWKNMRHTASLHVFYKILKDNGFEDSDMVIYTADDFSYDERTYHYGHFQSNAAIPTITEMPTGPFTPEMIYETIMGNHEKLLEMDENSNYFIFLSGHGNEYFLKLQNKHFITTPCLEESLIRLSKKVSKVFVIFDTCRAQSLLVKETLPSNIAVLTTSNFDQDSIASTYSNVDGNCSIDDFTKNLHIYSKFGIEGKISDFFKNLTQNFVFESDLTLFPEVDWDLSEFLKQDCSKKKLTKFIL